MRKTTQKRSKMLQLGVSVMVLVFGLSLTGCATLANLFFSGAETEQSKKFLNGANDILTGNPDGYPALQFKALYERKFPGITWTGNSADSFTFTSEGRKYTMSVSNIPRQQGNMQYFYWVAATGCKDMTPPEKAAK